MYSDFELTAYCGLYCGDCNRLNMKPLDLEQDLIRELESDAFRELVAIGDTSREGFKSYSHAIGYLRDLVNLHCAQPCRVGGGCSAFSCEIVKCCQGRDYAGCWECGDLEECDKGDFLKPFHGQNRLQNLKRIAEHGPERWAGHRSPFYKW